MSYAFGDSDLAAYRLQRLAEVFAPSSRAFLLREGRHGCDQAIDLGCGPGCTTHLLAESLSCVRAVGIDNSPRFIAMAQQTATERVRFCLHDFTTTPFPPGASDLMFARYELTHVRGPEAVIGAWGTQLRPAGRLLCEETEWIRTQDPTFTTYLAMSERMLADQGNQLYVGPRIDQIERTGPLVRRASRVYRFPVQGTVAAELFSLNLPTWRRRPYVQQNFTAGEIDALEADLRNIAEGEGDGPEIVWGLRQMVFERIDEEEMN